MKLNPLHTPEMLDQAVRSTGQYFCQDRRTGRSTALALEYIAAAIRNPHHIILIEDHHPTHLAGVELRHKAQAMVNALGLEHIWFTDRTICFSNTLPSSVGYTARLGRYKGTAPIVRGCGGHVYVE